MATSRRFGTFEGVFTPTFLTIIGVILYLRLGWVVGNAGILGAILIILLAKAATVTTGLALASMATNVRVGSGGFYAMISRSLGIEVGGAIGIPLYFSFTLSVALYIVGFTEGWLSLFPEHPVWLVKSLILLILLIITYIGAGTALKVQYLILAIIFGSLVSLFMGSGIGDHGSSQIWGEFDQVPFWQLFAIFFPAVTGIAAGAAMSGDLRDPRRALPIGILSAIGVTLVIYVGAAVWLHYQASPEVLVNDYTVMISISRWKGMIVAALLCATLSSALGTLVGGSRTLMALGQNKVVPFSRFFAWRSRRGEPRKAILVTAIIVEICLLLGDLNTIAPLLTMFFLITYGTINAAVFIEKKIGIPSYRPSFNIPLVIPLVGAIWCTVIMFLINAVFAAVALVIIVFIYLGQVRLGQKSPGGDVRAGMLTAVAEWAIRMEALMPQSAKTWKPNVIVPVEDPEYWQLRIDLIRDIVYPKGSVRLFTVKTGETSLASQIQQITRIFFGKNQAESSKDEGNTEKLESDLRQLLVPFQQQGILAAGTVIESNHFLEGISVVTQALKDMPLPPNVMFLSMSEDPDKDERLQELLSIAVREELGVIVLSLHPKKMLGEEQTVNLWLRGRGANRHLTTLTALQLGRNWDSIVRVLRVVDEESDIEEARRALRGVAERTRLPLDTEYEVLVGDFIKQLTEAPAADLNIFGMARDLNVNHLRQLSTNVNTSCLFVRDSGSESALV